MKKSNTMQCVIALLVAMCICLSLGACRGDIEPGSIQD